MDLLGRPRTNILAYTMPGFATGTQSKSQAWGLMRALEVSSQELDIRPSATQMLKDRAPSDGNAAAWLEDLERNVPT